MKVKELKSEGLVRSYNIVIPKADMVGKLEARIREIQPEVKLKGFRPGKVPISHIRKMFGQSIMKDVVQDTVTETTQKTMADKKIRPAGQPQIELRTKGTEVAKGEANLEYTLSVETIPEFEPVDPAQLKFTRLISTVTEQDIDEQLKTMAESQQNYRKKAKTAKAKRDDAVLINFTGRIDGKAFEGGTMEDHQLVLGSGMFLPGFEDQLIDTKAGDTLDVTVTFPKDYQVANLAGKKAVFETEILEVRSGIPARVDDELAGKMGFDDLDALRDAVTKQAGNEFDMQSRMRLKRAILDELDKTHSFDLPTGMVGAEFDTIWEQVEKERETGQLDEEDAKKSEKELKADYRKIAERRVRLGLVLAEMGTRAKIDITKDELQSAMAAQARRYPGQEQQMIEYYRKNPDAVAQIRAPIYEEKVVDHIIETAKITARTVSQDELFADDPLV